MSGTELTGFYWTELAWQLVWWQLAALVVVLVVTIAMTIGKAFREREPEQLDLFAISGASRPPEVKRPVRPHFAGMTRKAA